MDTYGYHEMYRNSKKVEKKHKKLHTPNPQIWPILQAKQEMPELEMQEVV